MLRGSGSSSWWTLPKVRSDAARRDGLPHPLDGRRGFEPLDLTGWNYLRRYARFRARYPDKPIAYSESASALSTRDFYDFPLPRRKTEYSHAARQVTSYDFNAAPWADSPDVEFDLMERDRFVAGEFVWAGFDDLSEPTPYAADARSSHFSIVDLVGIPKDRYFLYRSYWRPEATTVHIVPHWTWPDRLGQVVPVFVYTNGDSAELFLNGRSLGLRKKREVPARPPSFTLHAPAVASSEAGTTAAAAAAVDGNPDTHWTAGEPAGEIWWQADPGKARQVRFLRLLFPGEERNYGGEIHASSDATAWRWVATKPASDVPRCGRSPGGLLGPRLSRPLPPPCRGRSGRDCRRGQRESDVPGTVRRRPTASLPRQGDADPPHGSGAGRSGDRNGRSRRSRGARIRLQVAPPAEQ